MKTTIGGVEFDLAFTVEAQKKVEERFGGMDKNHIEQIFDTTDMVKFFENMAFMGATMINAGRHREAVRRMAMGETYEAREPITPEQVEALLTPGETPELKGVIAKTINEGNKVTVEIEPPKRKNTEATRSE